MEKGKATQTPRVRFNWVCCCFVDKGKSNEGKIEEREANNSSMSFSVFCKDVITVLNFMERLKNENQYDVEDDIIEKLRVELAFFCVYVHLSYCDLEQFDFIMARKQQEVKELIGSIDRRVGIKYGMHHVLTCLGDGIDDCISSCNRSKSCATMTEEQLDFLLLNLHHLSKYHAEQSFPLVSEYVILRNVCVNIRDFHGLKVNGCIEHAIVECVLPHFQVMAERVGLLLWDVQIHGDSRHFELAHLFLNIIPIELEVMEICFTSLKASRSAEVGDFIMQLLEISPDILREYLIHLQEHMLNVTTGSISGVRNIHVMIEFLLIIVTDMSKDFIYHDKFFDILAHVGALTREVSILVRGLEEKSKNEERDKETNHSTIDLLENIEDLKGNLKHVYLKTPVSPSQLSFPMRDGPLFMHLLLVHLKDLLNSDAYSVALIKEEIELVKKDLEHLRYFFVNVQQYQLYKDLWVRVLDVAYETKVVIDSIIVRDNGLLHLIFSLPIVMDKINFIKEEVFSLGEKISNNSCLIFGNPNKQSVESKSSTNDRIFVGFKEETEWIIRKLTRGPAELDVISIIGMPGSGKTTLAYKVYNDELVSSHFDIRVWCTVGQDSENLLEKIFNQVIGSDSNVYDVADQLRKHLFGKRYLIVLDDLWDTDTWDELTRPFPEVEKGSRIILTTRQKVVALHGERCSDPLYLRLLRLEEIWELFEKRVFGEENPCPDELLDVGKEIAGNCKGLPLVADLIVGVLAGKEKKRTAWLEVQNNLNSLIFENEVNVMKVIELSYNHLADHLKPCLLYLASWEKDKEHGIELLKPLWCGEGLVEQTEMKSIDEVVEVYLNYLISSSLVICFNDIRDYRIYQIHDLVHEFCLIKAREEKLLDSISSSAPSSSSDWMSRQMSIEYDGELFVLHPHLLHDFVMFNSKKKKNPGKHLYSLKITCDELYEPDNRLYDKCHLRHLRLLRVLSLDSSFMKVERPLLNEICMLVHLRFLCIRVEVKSLPLSFSNLWNLETLWLDNDGSPMVLLPTIWNLVKLRMLFIDNGHLFGLDSDESILIGEDSKLENLRIFVGLQLSYSKDAEDIFERFPNLQQLAFSLIDCSTEPYWFPKLDFLNELESLEVTFVSDEDRPFVAAKDQWDFHFSLGLKSLSLFNFSLTSDSLSTIARLPNLEELTLADTMEEWNMGDDDTFENLKRLRLIGGTLAKWEVGEESFPVLERLELRESYKLEEIPPTFGDIDTLKYIKLLWSPHLEESALKIKQYVEDMTGNDKLQVSVLE